MGNRYYLGVLFEAFSSADIEDMTYENNNAISALTGVSINTSLYIHYFTNKALLTFYEPDSLNLMKFDNNAKGELESMVERLKNVYIKGKITKHINLCYEPVHKMLGMNTEDIIIALAGVDNYNTVEKFIYSLNQKDEIPPPDNLVA